MTRASPPASQGLPCIQPPNCVCTFRRLLFKIAPRLSTLKWVYWLTETPAAVGVWILACGMPLPVCRMVGCCCTGADLSATMPWALAEGEVRIRAEPRSNERENDITEIEWIKPVKPAISFGEIPAAWVSAVFLPSRLAFSATAIMQFRCLLKTTLYRVRFIVNAFSVIFLINIHSNLN